MVGGSYSTVWYKCIQCDGGLDAALSKCPHCGYEHSEEELATLRNRLNKKSRLGMLIALVIFPAIIYFGYKYFAFN